MSRLTVNDPFAEVFPELFRGFLAPARPADAPALDAELPGVAKDDIHVEIEGNRVSISGEVKRQSEKKEGERVLRSERYYGNVARTFVLANEVDENKAEAKYDNGVLTLVLPKRAVAGGRKLTIS